MVDNNKAYETKCPGGSMVSNVLCMIQKIVLIIMFIMITLVLTDIHGMVKAQKEYATAVAAMASAQAAGAQNQMQMSGS